MFAIIETGGKQLLVKSGDLIFIEKIDGKKNDLVKFDKVLMMNDKIGTPYLKDTVITGKIQKQGKSKKKIIFKYTPKGHSSRKKGHRQFYTSVLIEKINNKNVDVKKEVVKDGK